MSSKKSQDVAIRSNIFQYMVSQAMLVINPPMGFVQANILSEEN